MKPYEKPRLVALSLSGNDMLCDGCAIDVVGDNADKVFMETLGDFLNIGNAFGNEVQCELQIEGYCKYTSTSNMIFNS